MKKFPHLEEECLCVFSSETSVSHTEAFWDTGSDKEVFLQYTRHVLNKVGKGPAINFGLMTFTVQHTDMLECKVATSQHGDCMSSNCHFSLSLRFPIQRGTACLAIASFHGLGEPLSFCILVP